MIISFDYFIGEINIAQLGQPAVQDNVIVFIKKYENRYLNETLSYAFAKLFLEQIAIDPIPARWGALLNGAEYTDANGTLQKWPGFVNEDLLSPIANFVYYWYQRDLETLSTGSGEVKVKPGSTMNSSAYKKAIAAWNTMVDQNAVLYDYLLNAKDGDGARLFPEFDLCKVRCIIGKMNPFGL